MKITTITGKDHEFGDNPESAVVVRYGGFGDVIQASSVFPLIAREGWRVVMNTDQVGERILKSNPHVDELLVQRKDQIHIDDLEGYWERMKASYGRFCNLTSSIERTLLRWPGDEVYRTESYKERHEKCNVNYLERTHDLADVPHEFDARFYPSKKEDLWAKQEIGRLRANKEMGLSVPVVMISLSGSGVHKVYPYWDHVIAGILEESPANVVLVGDSLCALLELGWERTKRVTRKAGRWNIRRTLAIAKYMDVVVGTETGVLNSVGLLPVPKVLMLSHSSVENLSKHWKRTINIEPWGAECYPCHKMHYNSSTCRRDPNGGRGVWCTHVITPKEVVDAITLQLQQYKAAA